MTVSEVLKNVHKGLVHFVIIESTNPTESMYENIDTIKKIWKNCSSQIFIYIGRIKK